MRKTLILVLVCLGTALLIGPSAAGPLSAATGAAQSATRNAVEHMTTDQAVQDVRWRRGRHWGGRRGHHYGWYRHPHHYHGWRHHRFYRYG